MRTRIALLSLAALASIPLAQANEWDKEGMALEDSCKGLFGNLSMIPKCGAFFFNSGKPVRMMIPHSIVPGGGTEIGPLFIQPLDIHNWAESNLTIDGGSSIRGFWFGDAALTFNHRKFGGEWNTARDSFQLQFYSRARGLQRMPFYGIGPNTSRTNLTDFKERDISTGASVFIPLQSWFAVGGAGEYLSPRISGVHDSGVRSIDNFYSEATAPGLAQQPNFSHYEVFATPRKEWRWTQVRSKVSWNYYRDHDTGRYSSHKFRIDFLQTIYPEWQTEPTGGGNGRTRRQPKYDSVLYISGRVSVAGAGTGKVVPFYLQDTLGGSDIDNIPTLRGFQDYRFRAPAQFFLQTQYERRLLPAAKPGATQSTLRSVAGAVGMLAFYDAGEVANKAGDLNFSDMRQSFGFGLTFWSGNKVWFRAYVGLGSGEGSHQFFGVTNPSAQQPHL
jgi:hypothetical protein